MQCELTIKTAQCGEANSWYKRENLIPTVTICYEYLKQILDSLPNETSPAVVTPADAAVGQFFWVVCYMRSDTQYSIFLMCQYLDMRKMPPTTLQPTSCCNLARTKRGD